jgi:hypothetical protein
MASTTFATLCAPSAATDFSRRGGATWTLTMTTLKSRRAATARAHPTAVGAIPDSAYRAETDRVVERDDDGPDVASASPSSDKERGRASSIEMQTPPKASRIAPSVAPKRRNPRAAIRLAPSRSMLLVQTSVRGLPGSGPLPTPAHRKIRAHPLSTILLVHEDASTELRDKRFTAQGSGLSFTP